MIRDVRPADADEIAAIYNPYVERSTVTFEEAPVAPDEMRRRIEAVRATSLPYVVAEEGGRVVGYSYASRWDGRSAYRFSVESTVYLAEECRGRGVGTRLYEALLARLESKDILVVIGRIALPNVGSVALHEKCGFVKVAHLPAVGFKSGRFIDVGYWQRTRSGGGSVRQP